MSGNTPEWVKYAKPGDPVVCVDDSDIGFGPVLIAGMRYRLREIYIVESVFCDAGEIGIYLETPRLPVAPNGIEYGFTPDRFRPADTTDLPESLTEILTRTNPVQWKENENV